MLPSLVSVSESPYVQDACLQTSSPTGPPLIWTLYPAETKVNEAAMNKGGGGMITANPHLD